MVKEVKLSFEAGYWEWHLKEDGKILYVLNDPADMLYAMRENPTDAINYLIDSMEDEAKNRIDYPEDNYGKAFPDTECAERFLELLPVCRESILTIMLEQLKRYMED